jgi:soluble lytic murein transglycosylase-like protein
MQLRELLRPKSSPFGGVTWKLGGQGLWIDGKRPVGTPGKPVTMGRIVEKYGKIVSFWSQEYSVPEELIYATIATETSGDPLSVREEPGYTSDAETPHRISAGLMQTLISTAAAALKAEQPDVVITREWLLDPNNSIQAGTCYIRRQYSKTGFHAPMVAAAYNAGSIIYDGGTNRWCMRCYPLGTGAHIDRFVLWFNDLFKL